MFEYIALFSPLLAEFSSLFWNQWIFPYSLYYFLYSLLVFNDTWGLMRHATFKLISTRSCFFGTLSLRSGNYVVFITLLFSAVSSIILNSRYLSFLTRMVGGRGRVQGVISPLDCLSDFIAILIPIWSCVPN